MGLEISIVGKMNISMHTRSEIPNVTEKHLTRFTKTGIAVVTYVYSNPPSWASEVFGRVGNGCRWIVYIY